MNIYEELSKLLGTFVNKDNFEKELAILGQSGRVTQRVMLDMIILLVKAVDEARN